MCTLVDTYSGRILKHLADVGLADDTIVIFTSDHGDMMGQLRMVTKSVQYERSVRVPLIIRIPGRDSQRITTPTSLVDVTPTVLELLGLAIPEHMQGSSLVPLLDAGDSAPDEAEVFIEWHDWDGIAQVPQAAAEQPLGLWDPAGGLVDKGETQPPSVDARTIRRGRWKLSLYATGEAELYDLIADPEETHNAVYDEECATIVDDLFERLQRWQRETNDSFELRRPTSRTS